VPIRVEFETETHRIRDVFVWNAHEALITPELFARVFLTDLELPTTPYADIISAQIRAQLEDADTVAKVDFGVDYSWLDPPLDDEFVDWTDPNLDVSEEARRGPEIPECRIVVAIDVQIGTYHLMDAIEWDLLSPLTPEAFARNLCAELGLAGEAAPLIAHAVHEELLKHKRDAIEWGLLDPTGVVAGEDEDDRGALSVLKDKTGLGLGWGKAPKDGKGRGPKTLRSVWKDWAEAEEFATRFEVLTPEEVERRELERERATRCVEICLSCFFTLTSC
jgi:chromatin structure-remodeling complex subunit SFH1